MAAKKENKKENLAVLVTRWGENKSKADALTKDVKKDAEQIKQTMIENEWSAIHGGIYTADLSFREDTTVDEQGMIEYLKSLKLSKCVKKVETVDWDALEKLIYSEKLTKEQVLELDKYKAVKKVPVLKLKVQKEG